MREQTEAQQEQEQDKTTRRVSAKCETITQWRTGASHKTCGAPTAYWYPAQGGGTMALCEECAKPLMAPAHGLRPYAGSAA